MELSMREEKEPHQGAAFSPAESPTAALMFDSLTTVSPNSTLQDTPVRELGPAEERPSCTCDPDGRSKITSTPFGVAPRTPLVFGPTPRQMRPVPFSPGESLAASFGAYARSEATAFYDVRGRCRRPGACAQVVRRYACFISAVFLKPTRAKAQN